MTTFELCGAFVLTAGAVLGWWKFFLERRDKRLAQERQASAEAKRAESEAELAQIRRRALTSAPYFLCSDRPLNGIEIFSEVPGERYFLHAGAGYLLDVLSTEVSKELPAGRCVVMVVENAGSAAVEIFADIDGSKIRIEHALNAEATGLTTFSYFYDPAKHGQRQALTIRFMTSDGIRDTHIYETMHGVKWLRRVDPQ